MPKTSPGGPAAHVDDVEYAAMEWVDRYKTAVGRSPLNDVAPDAYKVAHYAHIQASRPATPQL
jgi:hypothetical protein